MPTWRVVVDDPDARRAYAFTIQTATTDEAGETRALLDAARLAVIHDEGGCFHGPSRAWAQRGFMDADAVPVSWRRTWAEDEDGSGLVGAVALYATATLVQGHADGQTWRVNVDDPNLTEHHELLVHGMRSEQDACEEAARQLRTIDPAGWRRLSGQRARPGAFRRDPRVDQIAAYSDGAIA